MFTPPPDLGDADLVDVLLAGWDVEATGLQYLAVGFGSHHWRVTSPTGQWFLTIDDLIAKRREPSDSTDVTRRRLLAALATVTAVRNAGLAFAIAPIGTSAGEPAQPLGDRYVAALYPIVDGRTFDYGNYSDPQHRHAVVAAVAALHSAPAACRRQAMTDDLSVACRGALQAASADLGNVWNTGPYAEPARRLLAEHTERVVRGFATYDGLAAEVGARTDRFVLTHGEPHPANTIVTDRGVVLVDWDTVLIAPPERDLWDLVSEADDVAAQYEALTGVAVDPDAIELYRLAWDLAEIAIYVRDFRQPHERTDDTAEAWQNLQHYLDASRWP